MGNGSYFYGILNDRSDQETNKNTLTLWNKNLVIKTDDEDGYISNHKYTICVFGDQLSAGTIMHLIEKDGINGLKGLRVNVSIVIIDHIKEELVMYRGPVGRYPLFYTYNRDSIYWSNQIQRLSLTAAKLDPSYFKKYFIGGGYVDNWEETPFLNIKRVPRGKALVFKSLTDSPQILFEDPLKPNTQFSSATENELYTHFRELLSQSVNVHRGDSALFQCSGGLDSTALLLTNYFNNHQGDDVATLIFDKFKECDEREMAGKVIEGTGISWHKIVADTFLPFSNVQNAPFVYFSDEPSPDICFFPWRIAFFDYAKKLGHKNIISGHGGDDLLSGNYCYLSDLIRKGKLKKAWKESDTLAKRNHESGLNAAWYFKSYGLYPLLGLRQNPPYFDAWDPAIHNRFFVPSFFSNEDEGNTILQYMMGSIKSIRFETEYTTQLARTYSLVSNFQVVDSIGYQFSIKEHYPYLDRELMEFVLGLDSEKIVNGSGRKLLLENSFKSALPSDYSRVQGNFYKLTFKSLNTYWYDICDVVLNSPLFDMGIISKDKVIKFLESWKTGKEVDSTATLNSLIGVSIWLRQLEKMN